MLLSTRRYSCEALAVKVDSSGLRAMAHELSFVLCQSVDNAYAMQELPRWESTYVEYVNALSSITPVSVSCRVAKLVALTLWCR